MLGGPGVAVPGITGGDGMSLTIVPGLWIVVDVAWTASVSIGAGVFGIEEDKDRGSVPPAVGGAEVVAMLWPQGIEVFIFDGCWGVSGLEKLVLPLGVVGQVTFSSAGAGTGAMILPMFASLVLRVEFVAWRPLLIRGGDGFLMIVADLERLRWTKLPSKEDRSTIGSPSFEIGLSGDSSSLLRLEVGESPSGFSSTSSDASEDECVFVFVVGVEETSFS